MIIMNIIATVLLIAGLWSFGDTIYLNWKTRKYPRFDSIIEQRLYWALRNRGYKPKTQTRCGPFRIDLTIGNIAIECDGKDFHSSPAQQNYDRRRTAYLYRHGYKSVLRFTGSQINRNADECVSKISKKLRRG